MEIVSWEFDEYVQRVQAFHGFAAPGVIMGWAVVQMAKANMPEEGFIDVICETGTCLPDAIQLMTPCSVGNGWLKILELGRFACVFYDKQTGEGVRIYLDLKKLEKWSEIQTWFLKLKPKKMQDSDLLLAQIEEAGQSLFSLQKVRVPVSHTKISRIGKVATCQVCGESFPQAHGALCKGCSEPLPYEVIS